MTEKKEKQKEENEEKYREYTRKIQDNEQTIDDLQLEQRQQLEQLEESKWKMKQQTEEIASLYQELVHFGDVSASHSLADIQELSQQVNTAFRSQEETVQFSYQKVSRQLKETNDTLQKERGKLAW